LERVPKEAAFGLISVLIAHGFSSLKEIQSIFSKNQTTEAELTSKNVLSEVKKFNCGERNKEEV